MTDARQPSRIEHPHSSADEDVLAAARRYALRLRRFFRLHQWVFLTSNLVLILWLRAAWRLLLWGVLAWLMLLIFHGALVYIAERRAAILQRRAPPKNEVG
ncbi:MAG: hypothetical protein OXF83_05655 [Anaerolineaceae bacterium]|nr:hypothetical protein [Anaerolineaceae bacterium]MCY3936590.1 hypothetical protein [Chloroflexota bacterium]MCY4009322.1 hypothetical protein [Anaerolineaceae bacterium]MCY4106336.1 hypothetical protein [Chloroflexota bacterium]